MSVVELIDVFRVHRTPEGDAAALQGPVSGFDTNALTFFGTGGIALYAMPSGPNVVGGIAVQALARQAEVEDSQVVARLCPLLSSALRLVAHRVIRNRGTVCGSLAHADPASELPAVLLAVGGHVIARSVRGERLIAAEQLFKGVFETTLAPDELLVEAWFPELIDPFAILEESRRHGDFALAGVVRSGQHLALFGVAPTPVLADPQDPAAGLQPSGDLEATPEFRLQLVRVLTQRAFAA